MNSSETRSLDALGDGEVLADDCLASDGTLILPRDRVLTLPIIARLKKLGIRTVSVRVRAAASEADQVAMELELTEARFSGFEGNAYYAAIKEAVTEWLASGRPQGRDVE